MRRQTAVAGAATAGAGRFRLDPFALPVRQPAEAGTPAFTLDRDRAILRRRLGGIPAVLTVPVSAYRGVAVRIEPDGQDGDLEVFVELLHEDSRLTLTLLAVDDPEDAAADWMAWGRALGLPLLVIDSDGSIRVPRNRMGAVDVADMVARRGGSPLRGRRSRVSRRRQGGMDGGHDVVRSREIIART
ncbi:DUF6101 family protein [Bauldia sp.]|uniref:DUF6101 family protein n=1 Tax=Bauldia sp. TaxID=2575872 RepID=UPI003BAA99F4